MLSQDVCVLGCRTELVIYVLERPASGPAKRVLCVDLFNFLNQANIKPQLSAQLTVDNIVPKMGWSKEQLKEYLDKPPAGTLVESTFSFGVGGNPGDSVFEKSEVLEFFQILFPIRQ